MHGKLITFEGIDGCGKTSQTSLLATRLRDTGLRVTVTNEPGGTDLGKSIKELVLFQGAQISPKSELLLFFAARAQHFTRLLQPHLTSGKIVICDRFFDSTLAYQGYGRGIPLSALIWLQNFTATGLTPDLTFFLDITPAESLKRRGNHDRIESESEEFWEQTYKGFVLQALEHPNRITPIDASRSIGEVARQVWDETVSFLNLEFLKVKQTLQTRQLTSHETQISISHPAIPVR